MNEDNIGASNSRLDKVGFPWTDENIKALLRGYWYDFTLYWWAWVPIVVAGFIMGAVIF